MVNIGSSIPQSKDDSHIVEDISEGPEGITTEAVGGDSITNFLDSKVRDFPTTFDSFINDRIFLLSVSITRDVSLGSHCC